MKSELDILQRLAKYRAEANFIDNSMSWESGHVAEELCRELEWVLELPHKHERYERS